MDYINPVLAIAIIVFLWTVLLVIIAVGVTRSSRLARHREAPNVTTFFDRTTPEDKRFFDSLGENMEPKQYPRKGIWIDPKTRVAYRAHTLATASRFIECGYTFDETTTNRLNTEPAVYDQDKDKK